MRVSFGNGLTSLPASATDRCESCRVFNERILEHSMIVSVTTPTMSTTVQLDNQPSRSLKIEVPAERIRRHSFPRVHHSRIRAFAGRAVFGFDQIGEFGITQTVIIL